MDAIYTYARPSDHVDECKSARLLRFRLMFGENVRSFRSESKMGKSSERISTVQILTENYLELMENRKSSSGIFFPGLASMEILQKIQKELKDQNIEKEILKIESSSCQCSMRNSDKCIPNSKQVKNYAKRFSRGHWTFLVPGDEKK